MGRRNIEGFLSLPINEDETWQGGTVSLADVFGISDDGEKIALALWCSVSTELVHAVPAASLEQSHFDAALGALIEFSAEQQFPFRPAQIDCNDAEVAEELSSILEDSGTDVRFVAELPEWNAILNGLTEHMASAVPPMPSLADAGHNEEDIREFATAAAAFYRACLWDHLDDVDLIKIESPKPPRCLKHTVVLGAGGSTYGLGFYDDEEDHYDLMTQRVDPRELNLCHLTFDSPADASPLDVAMWRELSLPLETGDAYPTMTFFSKEGPRLPEPNELRFATVVLKALSESSEEELDTGRWTKQVEFVGKRKKCTLSIPNLLDPPNHQEWIRRGKMPEQRGHEHIFKGVQEFIDAEGGNMSLDELNAAINAKFTGPIDATESPTDSPEGRADALCQEAIESFGRRRIQLARQALAENPRHVEASLLLAEATRVADRRVVMFQDAKTLAVTELGPLMDDEAGQFWSIHETRPFMRACHGLANALREMGQVDQAIDQFLEMLRLNPNDNQGVRYELVPLLISHNRLTEASDLLKQYRESTVQWNYMQSLIEFRRTGKSPVSKKALRSAFKTNQHVVPMMQADEPPMFPDSYALGSPEEAAVCIGEMTQAWDETEGYVEWMFHEHHLWEKERAKRLRDRKRNQRKKKPKKTRRK